MKSGQYHNIPFDKCRKLWLSLLLQLCEQLSHSTLSPYNNKWITSCVIYLCVLCFETEELENLILFLITILRRIHTWRLTEFTRSQRDFRIPEKGPSKYFPQSLEITHPFVQSLLMYLVSTSQKRYMPESQNFIDGPPWTFVRKGHISKWWRSRKFRLPFCPILVVADWSFC